MSQPVRSKVFFLALCIAFVVAIVSTMQLHAADARHLIQRSTKAVPEAVPDVHPDVGRLEALTRGDARFHVEASTGLATFVGFGADGFALETSRQARASDADRALAFLGEFGAAFGIEDAAQELELASADSGDDGTRLQFIQLHRGLRVVGGEVNVYFDADGRLMAVDSQFVAGLDVDPHRALSRERVERIAADQVGSDLTTGQLVVVRDGDDASGSLAYEAETGLGTGVDGYVHIDGGDGTVLTDIDDDDPTTKLETHTVIAGPVPQTVSLTHHYTSPVVVCSAGHANNQVPAVTRVSDVTRSSFDLRLQNPGDLDNVEDETVHCIVAEEGQHVIDGHAFEARKYETAVTDHKGNWVGTEQAYLGEYDEPAVIGQVISTNVAEARWSVFWTKGTGRTLAPGPAALTTGRSVMEDVDVRRHPETLHYFVFESTHGMLGGVEFEAGVTPREVSGQPNGAPFACSFDTPFAAAPQIVLNQMAGVVGGDGGWSQTFGDEPTTATTVNLFIDEDQLSDPERSHDVERVAYVVFAADVAYPAPLRGPLGPPCDGDGCGEMLIELQMETFTVPAVDDTFRTVGPLANSYASPVVVCNARYTDNTRPVLTRLANVGPASFDLKLQNPSGDPVVADDVLCIVIEEGAWTLDGVSFEARKYETRVTDRHTRWLGQEQTYLNDYTAPVVVGQVMSFNDSDFSVYWQKGEARDVAPSAESLTNGITVLQDSDVTRNNETVGYIVFEAGHGPFFNTTYEARTGTDSVKGVDGVTPYSYSFLQTFARTPSFAVTSMAGANGGDGGWSQLHGNDALTPGTLNLSIDEDQILDRERSHMAEQVNYIVFERNVIFPGPPSAPRGGTPSPDGCDGLCDIR